MSTRGTTIQMTMSDAARAQLALARTLALFKSAQ